MKQGEEEETLFEPSVDEILRSTYSFDDDFKLSSLGGLTSGPIFLPLLGVAATSTSHKCHNHIHALAEAATVPSLDAKSLSP
ncbi:hypothetical protein HAX54_050071 [Datura stramonium]|uniref:Uncharacterized protein n=1 Tax=Datura stramonium TaxID=4076 RepID=A0ABS8RQT8_DATST|nr:hypothetical protein [Datura stramonium]